MPDKVVEKVYENKGAIDVLKEQLAENVSGHKKIEDSIAKNANIIEKLRCDVQDLKENYLVFKTSTALKLGLIVGAVSAVLTTLINWTISKI